ncbi:MAG TPA: selenium cofactor biosynthesis protein YqeC [Rubrobacteraceae bacterium]|nr:selenium cofactor biosynthesis protein YqeC [Rubrobacteraceae bacterium]
MNLYLALGITSGDVVAFAGAGGKTSAIREISAGLTRDGMRVLVAPTTKMMVSEAEQIGPLVTSEDPEELRARVREALTDANAVVAGSSLISKGRVGGIEPNLFGTLADLADVVLVEADGARHRLLKGTADHEPALPDVTTLVVALGNIRALGSPVDEEHVHRPQIFSDLTGISLGQSITARAFARALAKGSLGSIPYEAQPAILITGVEPGRSMSDASIITREIWRMGIKKVVLSSLPQESPGRVWIP